MCFKQHVTPHACKRIICSPLKILNFFLGFRLPAAKFPSNIITSNQFRDNIHKWLFEWLHFTFLKWIDTSCTVRFVLAVFSDQSILNARFNFIQNMRNLRYLRATGKVFSRWNMYFGNADSASFRISFHWKSDPSILFCSRFCLLSAYIIVWRENKVKKESIILCVLENMLFPLPDWLLLIRLLGEVKLSSWLFVVWTQCSHFSKDNAKFYKVASFKRPTRCHSLATSVYNLVFLFMCRASINETQSWVNS